jgi:hypothetical protein
MHVPSGGDIVAMKNHRFIEANTEVSKEDAFAPLAFAAWGVVMLGVAVALNALASSPLVLQVALLAP